MEEFVNASPMDLVITVCDEAAEECPYFPHARHQEHWGFPDPSKAIGTEEERLNVFRKVRDAIAERINAFLARRERVNRCMSRLVIIGESDAGIGAALRARKIIAVHAVRISNSLPGVTTNRSKNPDIR